MDPMQQALTRDAVYQTWENTLEEESEGINLEELSDEIQDLHEERPILIDKLVDVNSPQILLDAALKDQAFRSRIVGILVSLTELEIRISTITDACYNHIYATYPEHMATATTVKAREVYCTTLVQDGYAFHKDISGVIQVAKHIISDIDQCAWSLKLAMSGLQLSSKREI